MRGRGDCEMKAYRCDLCERFYVGHAPLKMQINNEKDQPWTHARELCVDCARRVIKVIEVVPPVAEEEQQADAEIVK